MQDDLLNIRREIKYIEYLFLNKQLDEFVERVQKNILPHVQKQQHMPHTQSVRTTQELQEQNKPKQPHFIKFQYIKQELKQSKTNILQKYDQMKLILFKLQRQICKLDIPMIDKGQWKINQINQNSRLGVKTKGTQVELRQQGFIQADIENLCIMMYLTELYRQWVPFCTDTQMVNQPSPLEMVLLVDFKIPFLTQRYSYMHGIAVDRIQKSGKLCIYAQGITHQKQLLIKVHKADKQQYEKKASKSVVLDIKYFICEITKQGNGKFLFRIYALLDSHMPLLPQKIVSYVTKQLAGVILDRVVKKANNFKNTPWQKQLKENQKRQVKNKFYKWLHERILNWAKTQVLIKSKI